MCESAMLYIARRITLHYLIIKIHVLFNSDLHTSCVHYLHMQQCNICSTALC